MYIYILSIVFFFSYRLVKYHKPLATQDQYEHALTLLWHGTSLLDLSPSKFCNDEQTSPYFPFSYTNLPAPCELEALWELISLVWAARFMLHPFSLIKQELYISNIWLRVLLSLSSQPIKSTQERFKASLDGSKLGLSRRGAQGIYYLWLFLSKIAYKLYQNAPTLGIYFQVPNML